MGSNDYMGGYLGNPKMQELHPPEEYVKMVIGNLTQGIQVSFLFSLFSAIYAHLEAWVLADNIPICALFNLGVI